MAITWDCNIANVNLANKRADVRFARTDDSTGAEWKINFKNTPIETSEQRTALLNTAWDKWQEELTKQTNIEEFLTNLEQLAKSNLEAREV